MSTTPEDVARDIMQHAVVADEEAWIAYAAEVIALDRAKERDALRERLDAFRADVESLREAWKIPNVLGHAVPHLALNRALNLDDERAKGEQR